MGQARLVGTEMASLKADLGLARGYGMGFKPQKDMTWDMDWGLSKNRPNRQAGPLTALLSGKAEFGASQSWYY